MFAWLFFQKLLQRTREIDCHIGMDFFWDEDDVLCVKPAKYIDKMMDSYKEMFGTAPSTHVYSPQEKWPPKTWWLRVTWCQEGTQQYQSLIDMLQWIISISCFDIQTPVITVSSFCACPWCGYLDRAKRIVGYIKKFEHATICFCIDLPDLNALPEQHCNWSTTMYGDSKDLFFLTCHNYLANLLSLWYTWTPTWCMIYYQENLSLASYMCWTKHQSTGTPRNRLPSKLLPLVQNMLPPVLLLSKSLCCTLLCITWVSRFVTAVICLVTTSLLLAIPLPLIQTCQGDMSCFPSTSLWSNCFWYGLLSLYLRWDQPSWHPQQALVKCCCMVPASGLPLLAKRHCQALWLTASSFFCFGSTRPTSMLSLHWHVQHIGEC